MNIVNIKVEEIKPYEQNPRFNDHAVEKVANSIKEFGMKQPIVIDENNVIIAGHTRLKALQKLGVDKAPCIIASDLTADQARAYRLADNKTNEFAEWDFELLQVELEEFEDLDISFNMVDFGFEDVLYDMESGQVQEDDYEVELPEEPISKRGDIWLLGNHRLMCGDSTSITDVDKLMNGNIADISFTSPPYNAGHTPTEASMGKTSKYENDDDNKSDDDYRQFLIDFTNNAMAHSQYTFVNVQSLAGNKTALIDYLYDMRDIYADTIIWDKMMAQPAMGENVLNSEFEYVHVFSNKANRAIGTKRFRGTLSNMLHLQKQSKNEYSDIHNATFPLEFAAYFVENFAGDSVSDLFGGTGTTLIAAEQLGKTCCMMELDPKYADVIINRWEEYTGEEAVLVNE